MPAQTLHFTRAPRSTAAGFLSTNPIDVDVIEVLRRWAGDRRDRTFEVIDHATDHAIATITCSSVDASARAQLDQQLAVLGIDVDVYRG